MSTGVLFIFRSTQSVLLFDMLFRAVLLRQATLRLTHIPQSGISPLAVLSSVVLAAARLSGKSLVISCRGCS